MLSVESVLKHLADMCAAAIHDKELCERAARLAASVVNDNRIEYAKDTPAGRVVFVTAWRYNFDTLDINVDRDRGEVMFVFKRLAMPALVLTMSRQQESAVMVSSELVGMYNTHNEILLTTIKKIVKGKL
jgi:hypothetical protein